MNVGEEKAIKILKMATTLKIKIDTNKYRKPTQKEIRDAKNYVLRRSEVAEEAWEMASDYIMDAVEDLVRIGYRYNIPPERFSFDASVSEEMMEEVAQVMDELDETLYDILQQEALSCTQVQKDRTWLLALLITLGHRNMSLRQTLQAYEWRMLHQTGALIASARYSNMNITQAISLAQRYIGRVGQAPPFAKTSPYRQLFTSPFIQSGGHTTYPDGSPNIQGVPVDGYNAIKQIYGIAIAQIWMKNQLLEMQQQGCAGYYQLRGSNYPCGICDDEVGFHEGIDPNDEPYPHPNCMCYRVPVYRNGQETGEIKANENE